MSNEIERILRTQPLAVLYGALATELARRGCDLNDPLWSARVVARRARLLTVKRPRQPTSRRPRPVSRRRCPRARA